MAQQFPTSAQVIYDTLVADTTFMAQLGTYTFKTGSPVAAISVVSPGESLPELRNVQGLECIIQDAGNVSRRNYVAGDADMQITYKLFLVCWEEANGQELTDAVIRVLTRFGGAQAIETVATTDGLGSLAQVQVLIPSDKPILG